MPTFKFLNDLGGKWENVRETLAADLLQFQTALNQKLDVSQDQNGDLRQDSANPSPLLDGNVHTDTISAAPADGSLIVGNSTPKWQTLPIGTPSTVLMSNGSNPQWQTIDLALNVAGVLPIAHGGTNSSTALSGQTIMKSDGTKIVQGPAGTATTVLHGNASGAPSYGAVDLTADVTGDLPLANVEPSASASRLLGRGSASAGDWQPLTVSTGLSISGTVLSVLVGSVVQAWAAILDAIAALSSNGLIARTAAGTVAARTITAGTNINVSNGDGVSGNPTVGITGTIPIANGGTNSATALSGSSIMVSDGSKVIQGTAGTSSQVLHGNASGTPTYGAVALATEVSGTLADGSLSSNVPLKNATNAFTGANSFATNPLDLLVGQIKFPATANPSADANTLDDYEEDVWTPTLKFGGATTGITYTTQVGHYIKVGGKFFGWGRIDLSSKGSATGAATITGLPFAERDGYAYGGHFSYYANMAAAVFSPTSYVTSQTMNLAYAAAGGIGGLTNAEFNNNTVLIWTVSYRV
jgi:hypothetical protein